MRTQLPPRPAASGRLEPVGAPHPHGRPREAP